MSGYIGLCIDDSAKGFGWGTGVELKCGTSPALSLGYGCNNFGNFEFLPARPLDISLKLPGSRS